MPLTAQQRLAVDAWKEGCNVRVVAVPGAGKSRVLLEACADADCVCMILAYNRDLCQDTKDRIEQMGLDDRVICMTFHGLCTYCVAPTHDDIALSEVIDELEAGTLVPPRRLKNVGAILIDEAQDFRPSFLCLIRHLIDTDERTQFMVVGDPMQMLYHYNEDDPAKLDYLAEPSNFFRSNRQWTSVVLDVTHRMTPQMAFLLSKMFDVNISSSKTTGRPVEIYTINPWRVGTLLYNIMKEEKYTECCILVPYKKNNRPLRKCVNDMSRWGLRLFVHGLDGQDPRIKRNKLAISTWHASKGTQKRVCVVLGMTDDVEVNPAFVAMSRGEERLIIVQDEQTPNRKLMRTLAEMPDAIVDMDATTQQLVKRAHELPEVPPYTSDSSLVCVDEWRPTGSGRWLCDMMDVHEDDVDEDIDEDDDGLDEEDEIIAGLVGNHEDVADVYRVACLMAVERGFSGKIRRLAEIRMPIRLQRENHHIAVKNGSHARFVAPNTPDDALLDAETRATVNVVYAKPDITPDDWCFLACAGRAWNGYHHTLRQLHPFDWIDPERLRMGIDVVTDALADESNLVFDARLTTMYADTMLHARCDATSDARAYLFTWGDITHSHRLEASIVAALHPRGACAIINIRTGKRQAVEIKHSRDILLDRLVASKQRRETQKVQ